MHRSSYSANGRPQYLSGSGISRALSRFSALMLVTGPALAVVAVDARAQPEEIPFSELSIILETNATDCDTGLQFFFDGEPWTEVKVDDPNGKRVIHVKAHGNLSGFGLTEQFNESNEPVMQELLDSLYGGECEDEAEFTLEELFELFPEGVYEFEGRTIEGDELDGEAILSHVIPAPPDILAPANEAEVDADFPLTIMWDLDPSPILPGLGPVDIVGFQVIVDREEPEPLLVFQVDLPADVTMVTVPAEFLEPGASYKFEVLQIDASGNQTIAEREFETAD